MSSLIWFILLPWPSTPTQEKKPEDGDQKEDSELPNHRPATKKPQKKKPAMDKFSQSQLYGGDSGTAFDHGNNRHIDAITILSDQNMVHGIAVTYFADKQAKAGSVPTSGGEILKMRPGEFITAVKVRSAKQDHSLTFITNRGTSLGPVEARKERKSKFAPPLTVFSVAWWERQEGT
jgi:hypothetical protein